MNNQIESKFYNYRDRLEETRTCLVNEIERIKQNDKTINGNLIHHIMTVKKIDEILSILEDIIEFNYFLKDKSEQVKLNYFLDVRTFKDQLGGN